MAVVSSLNRPPKPPMSVMTPPVKVEATMLLMRETKALPAPMFTPASV
jgi:hypothetical protein